MVSCDVIHPLVQAIGISTGIGIGIGIKLLG